MKPADRSPETVSVNVTPATLALLQKLEPYDTADLQAAKDA